MESRKRERDNILIKEYIQSGVGIEKWLVLKTFYIL